MLRPSPRARGILSSVNGCENLSACAFARLPQRQSLLNSIFLAMQTAAFDRLTDKGFLIGGEINFHLVSG
jgi:hypothetical protein